MWRSRVDGRPADSIKQFHRHLRVLNGTEPHGYSRALTAQVGSPVVTAPMSYRTSMRSSAELRRRRTMERRRNVLFSLAGVSVATLLLAIVGVPMMIVANVLCDALLAAYVGLLAYMHANATERDAKLRYLPSQPVLDLRDDTWAEAPAYATAGAH